MKLAVTGMGLVSPLGFRISEVWDRIHQHSRNGSPSAFSRGLFEISEDSLRGTVENSIEQSPIANAISAALKRPNNKFYLMALAAISDAMREAGWSSVEKSDAIVLGTTTGLLPFWEGPVMNYFKDGISSDALKESLEYLPLSKALEELQQLLKHDGLALIDCSACSASTHALSIAEDLIRSGQAKRALVGGVELLCSLTVKGFRSLQLVSEEPCKPFDLHRSGINLSEAGAFICLEPDRPNSELFLDAACFFSDAYHMTSPDPSAESSIRTIREALKRAALNPNEIDWVHAHGTGSLANDQVESKAISVVFGEKVPVSSTKGAHGHSLGASGLVESILCLESLKRNMALPSVGLKEPMLNLNFVLNDSSLPVKRILKNTLGFGGANSCAIFSRSLN